MHRLLPSARDTLLALALGLAVATAPATRAAPSTDAPASAATSGRATAAKARLAEVRAAIAKLVSDQRTTAAQRDAIDAQLAEQAARLSDAANALRDSDAAIAAKAASLDELQHRQAALGAQLSGQRAALADLLRAAYTLNRGSDLSLLLGDDDIARIDRALAYSRYFQHDRVARIRALLGQLAELDKLKSAIATATVALQLQRAQRVAAATQLEQARDTQRQLLAQADAQLAQQKDKLAALQRDAAALDTLLKQLQDVFADIPASAGKQIPFAQLRGKLAWPVSGKPRQGTGVLAPGLVIAAKPGAEVHAVAYGHVAWASFMRGYGMLVIVDQGGGWMSLYGGNEAALVAAGDWVKPGQPVATVGRAGEQGGAWFGLRKDGQPVDPTGWFATPR